MDLPMKSPKSFLLSRVAAAVTLALASTVSISVPAYADTGLTSQSRLAESQFKNVMTMSQYYGADGNLSLNLSAGPVTKSTSGFGIERNVQDFTRITYSGMPRALGGAPGTPAATMSQAKALAAGNDWMRRYVTSNAQLFSEELRRIGASAGILTYGEEVKITRQDAEPVTKILSWIVTVDRDGKAVYGSPVLTTPDPDIIYATYTPLRPGDEFGDENWKLPNPGTLGYQVLDSKGNAKTPMQYIDVGGAYDSIEGNAANDVIPCLMDKAVSACSIPASAPDIKSLMLKHAADYAIVEYTNQIVPVYDPVIGEDGEEELRPRGAISYNDRVYACTEYTNEGVYGFVLDITADRYFARLEADGTVSHNFNMRASGSMISPVKPFKKTVLAAAVPGNPAHYVISPLDGDDSLIATNSPELDGISYIAPVRAVNDIESLKEIQGSGFPWRFVGTDGERATFTWGAFKHYSHWTGQYRGQVKFNMRSLDAFSEFALVSQSIDDYALVAVNGTAVYSAPLGGMKSLERIGSPTRKDNCVGNTCGVVEFSMSNPTVAKVNEMLTRQGRTQYLASSVSDYVCAANNRCVIGALETFKSCVEATSYDGDGGYSSLGYYNCRNTTCPYRNELSLQVTDWNGNVTCDHTDTGYHHSSRYIDMIPYLKVGENVIDGYLVAQRGGYFYMTFKIKGCPNTYSLPVDATPPPVSTDNTKEGILDRLENNMTIPTKPATDD